VDQNLKPKKNTRTQNKAKNYLKQNRTKLKHLNKQAQITTTTKSQHAETRKIKEGRAFCRH